MKQKYLIILFFTFCPFGFIKAQTADSILSRQIEEVKVTTSVRPSSVLSSVPVQSLSSSDIQNTGIQSVADAVRRFNGVVVKDYGGIGGFKTINIRGNGSEHTTILYDGLPVTNTQSGQVDIGQFSLQNIDFLTLAIGQTDNIFRTARSIASVGSLDISTVSPNLSEKNNRMQANIETGSWGLFNPYLYYAQKLNKKFVLSVDGSWQRADGRYKYELQNELQTETGKRKNSDINTFRTEFNLFGNLSTTQRLIIKGYLFDSERGLPGALILYNPDKGKERLWEKYYFTQAKYFNNLSEKFEFQVLGKFSHSFMKYADGNSSQPESRYLQNEFYINGTLLYKVSNELSFSFANDFAYNTLNTNKSDFAKPVRFSNLSAVSGKYENDYLSIIGSLLGTYVTERVETGNKPEDRKRLSPALSFSYKPFSSSYLRLRASYKNIFRVPTFNDMYYMRLGSRNLVPEDAQQFNLGAVWSNSFSERFNYFSITTDFFYNRVKNKIIVYPTTFESRMVNLGKVRITGVDISIKNNLQINERIDIQLIGNYTYQRAVNITDPETKDYKDMIPYAPMHSGSASFSVQNPWINFSYSFIASSKSYSSVSNTDWYKVNGYTDHTLSLNKVFNIQQYAIRIQADITNIANKTYYIVSNYPMPGRGYRVSLNFKF